MLEMLDGRGVYGIELFETSGGRSAPENASEAQGVSQPDGGILVNEIAPRPHNSGHWTIEGARASQFEQHVRSVLGWPLSAAERRSPAVTTNVLGDVEKPQPAELSGVEAVLEEPSASLHWYGKREVRPLRKMGHDTLTDTDADAATLLEQARDLRDGLTFR